MSLSVHKLDNDRELFNEIIVRLQEHYDFIVEKPFNDGYRIFKLKSGYVLGDFNSDGFNLLYNIDRLSLILKGFLE